MTITKRGPMKAILLEGKPRPGSVFEPKLDGHRVIVHKQGDELTIYSRTFKEQVGKLPHLEKAFRAIPCDFILDGEIIVADNVVEIEGEQVPISSFSVTSSVMGSDKTRRMRSRAKLSFIAFDCLSALGEDLTQVEDAVRRGAADQIVQMLRVHTPNVSLMPRWEAASDYQAIFEAIVAAGGEGIMVKNPRAYYTPSASPRNVWSKLKAVHTADVVVIGYKPGEGEIRGLIGAIEFAQYKGGDGTPERPGILAPRSRCSGMDMAMRRHITDHQEDYIGKVMVVTYNGRTDGPKRNFKFPQFAGFRDDKLPEQCTWD